MKKILQKFKHQPLSRNLKKYKKKARRLAKRNRNERKKIRLNKEWLIAPSGFHFKTAKSHNLVCAFLEMLRHEFKTQTVIRIDFHKVNEIHPYAMLLIYAEIHRLNEIFSGKVSYDCKPPDDEIACKVFQKIGLSELLNIKTKYEITAMDSTVIHWSCAHGSNNTIELAKSISDTIKRLLPSKDKDILRGYGEAMDNSVFHAYKLDREDGIETEIKKRWWSFLSFKDNHLTVVFCDLGAGIPRTLPIQWGSQIRNILVKRNVNRSKFDQKLLDKSLTLKKDARSISTSMIDGETSTKLIHRGRGLKHIRFAAEQLKGQLLIISNRALINFDFSDERPVVDPKAFKSSIKGTIIQWRIPIPEHPAAMPQLADLAVSDHE